MVKKLSRPMIVATFVTISLGLFFATGCQFPQARTGDSGFDEYYPPQPAMSQPASNGSQRYPSMMRGGGLQRGIDGAPAFGAGPGGSSISPY